MPSAARHPRLSAAQLRLVVRPNAGMRSASLAFLENLLISGPSNIVGLVGRSHLVGHDQLFGWLMRNATEAPVASKECWRRRRLQVVLN